MWVRAPLIENHSLSEYVGPMFENLPTVLTVRWLGSPSILVPHFHFRELLTLSRSNEIEPTSYVTKRLDPSVWSRETPRIKKKCFSLTDKQYVLIFDCRRGSKSLHRPDLTRRMRSQNVHKHAKCTVYF